MRRVVGMVLVVLAFGAAACAGSRPALDEEAGVPREVEEASTTTIDGATDDAPAPVVLRLAVGTAWSGDPADAGPASVITRVLADLLHEGLARLDDDGSVVPALAEQWFISDDRLTWTFVLSDGLVDGAGAALTARDVMRSLDHVAVRGPSDQAAVALAAIDGWDERMTGVTGGVAGLSAPDDRTLVVRLERPFELLPDVLASPAYGIVALTDDGDVRTTGAYRYGETDDVLLAVDPAAPVGRIELVDAGDNGGAELLGAGTVDWAVLPAGRGADDLPGDILRQPLDLRVGLVVRLADETLRHGIVGAVDPLTLTTGVAAFSPVVSPPAEADAALPGAVTIELPEGHLRLVAAAIADQLEAAGVDVMRVESDAAEFAARVVSGEAEVFPTVVPFGRDDVVSLLQAHTPGGVDDVFGTSSEERTALAAAIEAEQDLDQRAILVDALEDALREEGILRIVGGLEVRLGVGSVISGLRHRADGTLVLDGVRASD